MTVLTDDLEFALIYNETVVEGRCTRRVEPRTLDHLDVIGDETDFVLDLKTRVASLLQDQASSPTLEDLGFNIRLRCIDGDMRQTSRIAHQQQADKGTTSSAYLTATSK